jgi:site-specific DNA recombinase
VGLPPSVIEKVGSKLRQVLKTRTALLDAEARRLRLRISHLEEERRRLLQAHLSGAVPVDLLREEQDRLTRN